MTKRSILYILAAFALYWWAVLGFKLPVLFADEAQWTATAYCKGSTTASGLPVKRGMVASDPSILPLGSVVYVSQTGDDKFDGLYVVEDTGPAVKGRLLDVYMWSCFEALDFGRREIAVRVLRTGRMPNRMVTR